MNSVLSDGGRTSRRPVRRVIVIGAGMIGLSTAWHLLRAGVAVELLESGTAGAGCSWGNAGWATPALSYPLNDPSLLRSGAMAALRPSSPVYVPPSLSPRLWRFLASFSYNCRPTAWARTARVLAKLNASALDEFDVLSSGGVAAQAQPARPFVLAFTSNAQRDRYLAHLDRLAAFGQHAQARIVDAQELRSVVPTLGPDVRWGLTLPGQRFIDPPRFIAALADAVRGTGGIVHEQSTVTQIRPLATGVRIETQQDQTYFADAAVIATGALMNRLSKQFGVKLLVQAGRGYSVALNPDGAPTTPIYFPDHRLACTPLMGSYRIAGMMEFRRPDAPIDKRRVAALTNAARPLLPHLSWDSVRHEWVGSRPCSTDGLPLVGVTSSPRVFVAGGHGMWGISLGPLTGRLIAQAILEPAESSLMRALDPLR